MNEEDLLNELMSVKSLDSLPSNTTQTVTNTSPIRKPMNVHNPERGPDESFDDYKVRRKVSKQIVDSLTKPPKQRPAQHKFDNSRFFLGVHKNPARSAERKQLKLRRLTSRAISTKNANRVRSHVRNSLEAQEAK